MTSLRNRLIGILAAYQEFLDAHPPGEPIVGKTYIADGWKYKDLPQLTKEQFDTFINVVGEENINWLTKASLGHGDSTTYRGQLLISPKGQVNLATYLVSEH